MLELIGGIAVALVGLVATITSTASWPTLRRRIRDHVSLAKDTPQAIAQDSGLTQLLTDELAELVRRDRRRLDERFRRLRVAMRAIGTVLAGAATTLAAGALITTVDRSFDGDEASLSQFAATLGIAAAVAAVIVVLLSLRASRRAGEIDHFAEAVARSVRPGPDAGAGEDDGQTSPSPR